ncbi:MAG TPA: signal peptidase I [Streptosporangiaceae bacterium]|nr:signal peptidase I [Streptosporangiaceae bacterium]
MTDDEQGVREPASAHYEADRDVPQDDRRDVRSDADGTLPDDKPLVTTEPDGAADGSSEGAQTAHRDSGHGAPGSEKEKESDSGKKGGSFWRELPVLVGIALVLALIIKAFAVQAFYIPSASMENTLQIGDRVLVNKIVYHTRDIARGDTVVFSGLDSWDPEVDYSEPSNPISKALHAIGGAFGLVPGEKDYIKRVIGVPGDRVRCCDARGHITVNGTPLQETTYLYPGNKPSGQQFDVTVPQGRLWVMGDHRDVSYDSRGHLGDPGSGTIPEDRVIGRAFVVVWPLSRIKTLPIPNTFDQPALAAAALPATPLALGFAGAVPIMWLLRLRRGRGRRHTR